jgi:DNA-binding transcriptional LysR family regulator
VLRHDCSQTIDSHRAPLAAVGIVSGDGRAVDLPTAHKLVRKCTGAIAQPTHDGEMTNSREPDWNDVRYFLAVARSGSLAGAARLLGVRHTTVSRRLIALEQSLGVSLVVRRAEGIELTPLGRKLLPMADDLERTMQALLKLARSGRNHVRLALPSGLSTLFAARIAAFQAAHPDIALDLASGSRPVDLQQGEADLALRIGPIADETLIAQRLCTSGWSLYASQRYLDRHPAPGDPRHLAGHEVIGFHASLAGVPGAKWVEAHGAGATTVLHLAEMTEMLAAALSGAGLAILPCILADGEPRLLRLTREIIGSQVVSLVYRREAGLEPPVRAVIGFAASVIKDNAALIGGERT